MRISVVTFILLFSLIFSGRAQLMESIPLLTVSGESVVKAIPDQAIISVRVYKKIDFVNINAVTDVFMFSKENTDIKFIDINNESIFSTIPEVDVNNKTAVFVKEFIITVSNLSELPKVIMALLRHDFGNIYSIRYRLSNLDQVMSAARKEAVANARFKATMLAAELDQTIGKAYLVKEEDVPVNNWYLEKNKPGIIELLGINYYFNPGYISVPCKVTVSFDLK